MKRAVVSGATGAIGMALVKKLIDSSVEVLILCRKGSKRVEKIPKSPLITICECGLADMADFELQTDKKYDVFYHFAWDGTIGENRNNTFLQSDNVKYALCAVGLAKRLGCHTFIGAGSQAEYGRVEGKLSEKTPQNPENAYGIAKLCAGQLTRILCKEIGIRHIWTRILSVYGEHDGENTMVMSTIQKLSSGQTPKFTKGEQLWDYLYSADAAEAFFLLGEKGKDGKVYVIGAGKAAPLKDYIYKIRDAVDPTAQLGIGDIPYGSLQVMHLEADISELKMDTGFEPKVSFEDGIKRTVKWYRKEMGN